MPAKVVVGVQWGDEGKGKIIDILASRAEVVVRSQGGNNAGHTVESNGQVYKLQLIPSGILYPNTLCLLGSGVVINPEGILGEIDGLESRGISCDMLRIDPRAHVIMPWHLVLERKKEKMNPKKVAYLFSLGFAILLSLITGHVILSPSVSIYVALILILLYNELYKESKL